MEIKVKYPYLFKFIIGILQATLAFYALYYSNFLNAIGCCILVILLQVIKKHIKLII
jgi:hypothetical protein